MTQPCKVVLEKYDHESNHVPYPITRKLSIRIKNRSLKTGKIMDKTQRNKLDIDDLVKFPEPLSPVKKMKKLILKRDGERIIAIVFNKDPTDDDFTAVLEYLIQKHKENKTKTWQVSTSEAKKDHRIDKVSLADQYPIADKVPLVNQDPTLDKVHLIGQDPIVDKVPLVDQDPIFDNIPLLDQDPLFDNISLVDQDPLLDQDPIVDQNPIVEQEPINHDPIVDQNPIVEQNLLVGQDLLKSSNDSYDEDIDFTIVSRKSDYDNSSKISSSLESTLLKTANKFEEEISDASQSSKVAPDDVLFRVAESLFLLSESETNAKFCLSCKRYLNGTCVKHGDPMKKLKQTKAVLSLPIGMTIQESSIPNAGLGVFAVAVHEAGSVFGKMEGEVLNENEYNARVNKAYVWEVYNDENTKILHYLDCQDETKSDWMRFVNCARFEEEQNLIAEQYGDGIYYKAYKKILPGDELLVWYGNAYGNELREIFVASSNSIKGISSNGQTKTESFPDELGCEKQNLLIDDIILNESQSLVIKEDLLLEERNLKEEIQMRNKSHNVDVDIKDLLRQQSEKCSFLESLSFVNEKSDVLCNHENAKENLNIADHSALFDKDILTKNLHVKNDAVTQCNPISSNPEFGETDHYCVPPFHLEEKQQLQNGQSFDLILDSSVNMHKPVVSSRLIEYRFGNETRFQCQICFSTFADKSSLLVHTCAVFTNIKSYSCSFCCKKFVRADNLRGHISANHEKVLPFACNICNRYFKRTDLLERHLKLHGIMRKFVCKMCGGHYHSNYTLKKHICVRQQVSKEALEGFCSRCDKTFTDINRHYHLVHKIKSSKRCDVCGQFYLNLGKHMTKHKFIKQNRIKPNNVRM